MDCWGHCGSSSDSDLSQIPHELVPKVHCCLKLDWSQLWKHSLSIQIFHWCKICQTDCRDLTCGLCRWTERFPFPHLSHTTLGAQLWFCPTSSSCVPPSGTCSLPRGEGGQSSSWLEHTYSDPRWVWWLQLVCVQKYLWWWKMAASCLRLGHACSGGSSFWSPWKQGLAIRGGGDPISWMPLNSGASFCSQTTLPLGTFLARGAPHSHPLCCIYAANSSPFPRYTLNPTL